MGEAQSPEAALDLMLELTRSGFRVWIDEARVLHVGPRDRLTPEIREQIRGHRDQLTCELLVAETADWARIPQGEPPLFDLAPPAIKDRMRSSMHSAARAAVEGDLALCQTALEVYRRAATEAAAERRIALGEFRAGISGCGEG